MLGLHFRLDAVLAAARVSPFLGRGSTFCSRPITIFPCSSPAPQLEPFVQAGHLVIDGGLATELSRRGFDLSDPLWSARLLADAPEATRNITAITDSMKRFW